MNSGNNHLYSISLKLFYIFSFYKIFNFQFVVKIVNTIINYSTNYYLVVIIINIIV